MSDKIQKLLGLVGSFWRFCLAARTCANRPRGSGHISVSMMHLAKGLEFCAVAVMASDDEIFPLQERIESVGDEADLQEIYDAERHLLYVAISRARDCVLVTSVEPSSEFFDDLKVTQKIARPLEHGLNQEIRWWRNRNFHTLRETRWIIRENRFAYNPNAARFISKRSRIARPELITRECCVQQQGSPRGAATFPTVGCCSGHLFRRRA